MTTSLRRAVVAALALAPAKLVAQEPAPLTLVEAVERALARHPSVAAADAAASGAESGVREAAAARLPTVAAEASAVRFAEPMVVAPLHGFDPGRPPSFDRTLVQGSVALAYTLFDGGARGARIERAEALADAAAAGAAATRQAVIAEAAAAYLRVAGARELAAAQERRLAALERERDRAAQLYDRGRAARVAVLRAEAASSAARAEAVATRSDLEVAERALARLVGLDAAAVAASVLPVVRSKIGPDADAAEVAERAAREGPELARLRGRVAAANAALGEARALWLPRVEAAGRYVEYGSEAGREQGEWQGGLQLSYPLFTGGARRAAAARAAAERAAAAAELAEAERRLRDAVDGALAAVASARARVAALEAAVEQSEEIARIERLALDAGAGVQTDYLAAEAELLRARATLTEARHAELRAELELARVTGALSMEWLERNLEAGP